MNNIFNMDSATTSVMFIANNLNALFRCSCTHAIYFSTHATE